MENSYKSEKEKISNKSKTIDLSKSKIENSKIEESVELSEVIDFDHNI
jgi:hypothetical protein